MIDKKCPKCGSTDFQIVDYYITGYIYEVENGYVMGDGVDDGGKHVKTVCTCRKCGYCWHPRKIEFTIDE